MQESMSLKYETASEPLHISVELQYSPLHRQHLCRHAANRRIPPYTSLVIAKEVHPGGNPGANLKSISHRCHPILVAFVLKKPSICPRVASRVVLRRYTPSPLAKFSASTHLDQDALAAPLLDSRVRSHRPIPPQHIRHRPRLAVVGDLRVQGK